MSKVRILDVETTIYTSFKRKANPFDERNWTVYVGTLDTDADLHTGHKIVHFQSKEASRDWLVDVLADNPKILVTFNGKFDITHGIAQSPAGLEAWMNWVVGGGILWDCQLAEYLLRAMVPEAQMVSLDETAPAYGGTVKPNEVAELWKAGVDTPNISPDIIIPYLKGDCTNTALIFQGQLKLARERGQLRSLLLNMGALVYTIEAERNGQAVDLELGLELAKDLEAEAEQLSKELASFIPADLPFEFNWGSTRHQSALIFGGTVSYDRREYKTTSPSATGYTFDEKDPGIVYAMKDELHYILHDGSTMECGAYNQMATQIQVTEDKVVQRFASGKNAGMRKTKNVKVPDRTKPKSRMGTDTYTFPGYTQPEKRWEGATPGVYSVASEVIEELGARDIPFLKALSRRAAVVKDLGTYFIRDDPKRGRVGMLTLVNEGIIHHKLNMVNTVTARLSSSDPNLQNLPKKNKSKVKTVFVSRFGKNGRVVQSDFTALEIYIQAIVTQCANLIRDLLAGLDMHCKRVALKQGISYEEAVRLCKVEAHEEWVILRTKAKEFSFQRAYGAGVAALVESTGLPEEEIRQLIANELVEYPETETFFEELGSMLCANVVQLPRYVQHPDFPAKTVQLGRAFWQSPDGKVYAWDQHTAPKYVVEQKGQWASFSPPELKNYPIQGGGAEWAKAAMRMAVIEFYRRRNFGGLAVLTNQVHDACYADAHESVLLEAAALLHACMESATEYMEHYFSWPMPVHVPSETTAGLTLAQEEKIPGLVEAAAALRPQLKQLHMTN